MTRRRRTTEPLHTNGWRRRWPGARSRPPPSVKAPGERSRAEI
ncbi:hypothetical protein MUK42_27921 [Musa troglodytarum]|uniref:Uncharacterized protein n=1 Tax=Musa troglodytarum TaxID=320322 RepID=A0A9E7F5V0_9LILI|nr:hypothetical protein MUK42_27921 [Musa troglodytarum]